MDNIKLQTPVKHILVTQPFGVEYVNFYKKLGLLAHNGTDLYTRRGCPSRASHSGRITWAGTDGDGGISVEIWDINKGFKTIYYHLQDVSVRVGQDVKVGELIGHCDNTGKYTTGDHLHFGLKLTDQNGNTINKNNGYNGAIDPAPYFPSGWEQSEAVKRYGKVRNWSAEFRVLRELIPFLKYKPAYEQICACVYGAWAREDVQNPALREQYAYLKKDEFLRGIKPFSI